MTVGGRCVLKTSNQPFGLNRIERRLCEYRKHCMSLQFTTTSFQDDDESVIGRVFRNKQMESTPNVGYYSTRDYPHLEIAVKCRIQTSLALPLLQPNNGECVGVLELVECCYDIFSPLSHIIELFELSPLEAHLPFELQIKGRKKPKVPQKIIKAIRVVCRTHRLPLAQIWIPDGPSRASYFWATAESYDEEFAFSIDRFKFACETHPLRKGQGVVGKAFLSRKPCFCRDVSQLPIAEYPLSHYARKYWLTGCFAICLHTKNNDYVLEFFLPPLNTTSGDPRTDLESIFTMTKNHLQGFEICLGGGRGPGEESYVEVVNISIHDDGQDSFKIFQTFGIQPLSASSQNETREEQVQNNVTDEAVVVDDDNDVALAWLDNRVEMLEEGRENELVQLSDDESAMEAGRKNEVNVVYSEQNGVASTSGRISGREETSEREYIRTDGSLSREDLTQHFGKKLDNAAAILGVSRSTMKRACRVKGIKKWPFPKRKKVKPSPSNLKHINKRVRDGTKQIPKFDNSEPSCSHPPPTQTTGVVAHTIPNVTPKQDEGNVTVKATYGDKMIRFPLTFSSRKADLMEKVTLRLPLKDGAFYIKYEDDDGDWIFVACDEDLEECIRISKGKSTIKMLVQPITNEAP